MSTSLPHQPAHWVGDTPPAASVPTPAGSTEPSLGQLVKDASASFSTIVRGEIELAKLELRSSVKNGGVGIGFFVVAAAIALFSLLFLFIGIAELIAWLGVVRYGAYLIVFGAMLLVAALAGFIGFRQVRKVRAPTQTITTTKETVAYLKERQQRG